MYEMLDLNPSIPKKRREREVGRGRERVGRREERREG
jgi:hypothetical protein